MICFCPGLVFCIFSALFSQMVKFATSVDSLFYRCMQFIFKAIVDAYQARKDDNLPDNAIQVPTPIVGTAVSEPLLAAGSLLVRSDLRDQLTFPAQPETGHLCDQSGSNVGGDFECTPSFNTQPVAKMLQFHASTVDDSVPTAPNFIQNVNPLTPSLTRMFRRN